MTAKKGFDVHPRVGIAMSVLSPTERKAVARAIRSPEDFDLCAADPTRSKKLETPDELDVLRVTPQIRLVFKQMGKGIEVLDLVDQATIDRFATRKPARKTAMYQALADATGLSQKQVASVFDELAKLIQREVGRKEPVVIDVLPDQNPSFCWEGMSASFRRSLHRCHVSPFPKEDWKSAIVPMYQ